MSIEQFILSNLIIFLIQGSNLQSSQLAQSSQSSQLSINLHQSYQLDKQSNKNIYSSIVVPKQQNIQLRLLQQSQLFLQHSVKYLGFMFAIVRNSIIIGIVFNCIDTFLPIIYFCEMTILLAFWDYLLPTYLIQFYLYIFTKPYDPFNIIRLNLQNTNNSQTLHLISKYGFSDSICYNLSGQIVITIILLILTLLVLLANTILTLDKLRFIRSKLRPIWNSYIYAIMPRIVLFSSLQLRHSLPLLNINSVINSFISIIFLILLLLYCILVFLQIRGLNQKVQDLQQTQQQLGLTSRLNYCQQFQFDCLCFSILYIPVINYCKYFIIFLCVGAAYHQRNVACLAVIIGEIMNLIMNGLCSQYCKSRDRIIYTFCSFLKFLLTIALLFGNFSQEQQKLEITIITTKIVFSLLYVLWSLMLFSIIYDISEIFYNNYYLKLQEQINADKQQLYQKESQEVLIQQKFNVKDTNIPKIIIDFQEQKDYKSQEDQKIIKLHQFRKKHKNVIINKMKVKKIL